MERRVRGKGVLNTEIKNAVNAARDMAQYDENAKRLLGNKSILAHILTSTVEEFRDMNPADVEGYIEGEPCISSVPVEPGLTNIKQGGKRLAGLNSESVDVNEGVVRFDIVFYVRLKDGVSQIIINIEAQKDAPSGYSILNRGIFYACRLISSQKERDFVNTNYDDIKCVYTIWICMNMPENSLDYYQLANRKVLGSRTWEGKQDMINIVLIGLAKDLPVHDEKYELHRLLVALMSKQLTTSEKLNIIEKEYKIQVNDTLRKDVSVMCNLSQGIVDETLEKVVLNMNRLGYTSEQIAKAVEMSKEAVERIIEVNKFILA
jgi:hypothetical protein